ncbi:CoA pyrophosphatase, partial [archaeon]
MKHFTKLVRRMDFDGRLFRSCSSMAHFRHRSQNAARAFKEHSRGISQVSRKVLQDSLKESIPLIHPPNPTEVARTSKPKAVAASVGIFHSAESDDIQELVNNFTAPALATALRDREDILQNAALLADQGDFERLKNLLFPFLKKNIEQSRMRNFSFDLSNGFSRKALLLIQGYLHRMPRYVYHGSERRASVVIPLCNVQGIPSILFERRSATVRTHKQQVCFPGGMVEYGVDASVIETCLREMEEELGVPSDKTEVLGILRCNWNEVASMTGIAVTPVVGYIGELKDITLKPNADEVEKYFTVPIHEIMDEKKWLSSSFTTPAFTGGPHTIWGLTGYLLERFRRDILQK